MVLFKIFCSEQNTLMNLTLFLFIKIKMNIALPVIIALFDVPLLNLNNCRPDRLFGKAY